MKELEEISLLSEHELREKLTSLIQEKHDLKQQVQEMTEIMKDLQQQVNHEKMESWTWKDIRNKFHAEKNLLKASDFLYDVLKMKAICENNKCYAFDDLEAVSPLLFMLEKNYGTHDLKIAQAKFRSKQKILKEFTAHYWKIRFKLGKTLDHISRIGIANETQKEIAFQMQDRYDEHEIEMLQNCENATVNLELNKAGTIRRNADSNMMTSLDFKNSGIKNWLDNREKVIKEEMKRKKTKKTEED